MVNFPVPLVRSAWSRKTQQWWFTLYRDYTFDYNGILVVAKKGFVYDGATVPRPLWPVIPPMGLGLLGVLWHDYVIHELQGQLTPTFYLPKIECDRHFARLMKVDKVQRWKRQIAYRGVRLYKGY